MQSNPKWAKKWAGNTWGTNTGKFFLSVTYGQKEATGLLRFCDSAPGLGTVVYDLTGTLNDDTLSLTGTPTQPTDGVTVGDLELEAKLTSTGSLYGDWKTSIGTGGTFRAWPHDYEDETPTINKLSTQLFTRNIEISPLFLNLEGIKQILTDISKNLPSADIIMHYECDNNVTKSLYSEKFLERVRDDSDFINSIKKLRFFASSPSEDGINNNVISLEFGYINNHVSVQGIDETWVVGVCEMIKRLLKNNESLSKAVYKKFGIWVNYLLFAGTLIILPSIATFWGRSFVVFFMLGWISLFAFIHNKTTPSLTITNLPIPQKSMIWDKCREYIFATIKALGPVIFGFLLDHYFGGDLITSL